MKVVAFCGSARKAGNTFILLETALEPLRAAGVETEIVELSGAKISGCKACYGCFKKKDGHCVVDDDIINECIDKMVAADGIHPNDDGYDMWGRHIANSILQEWEKRMNGATPTSQNARTSFERNSSTG